MKKTLLILSGILLVSALLAAAEIRVSEPNARSEWCAGTTYTIAWTPSGSMPNRVTIRLRRAGSASSDPAVLVIAPDAPLVEPFRWAIPNTVPPGMYFIRVRTVGGTEALPDVTGDSADFKIKSCWQAAPPPPMQIDPRLLVHTLTMPVNFRSEKLVWYRFTDLGPLEVFCPRERMRNPLGDIPATEMLVGYYNQWIHNDVCPNECYNLYYRSSPLWDAARLSTLVGKTIAKATLILNHKVTVHDPICPSCPDCLFKVHFYEGLMGDTHATPHDTRTLSVGTASAVNIDVTDMMSNWLREKDPSYHGERHNYHMVFIGPNEEHNCNNQKCLTWYHNASLEIKYRD